MPGPAARIGDMTAHGGVIVLGFPTVLIQGQPASRLSDMHTCPMVTAVVPHVGGPILSPCVPNVLVGGMPQATLGDIVTCVGPPDVIVLGAPTVLVGTSGGAGGGGGGGGGGLSGVIGGVASAILAAISPAYPRAVLQPDGSFVTEYSEGIVIKGTPEYQVKAVAALDRLNQTPTGKGLIESINESGKKVTIIAPDPGKGNTEYAANWDDGLYDYANDEPGPGSDSTVKFNPDRNKLNGEDWMTRDPAIGLGHELIHANHDAHGTTDGRDNVGYKGADGKNYTAPGYEVQTVGLGPHKDEPYTENKLRKDFDDGGISTEGGEKQRPRY